jgi:DNA-binding transcriptional regulator YdaS (Cro superfamily)
MNGLALLRKYQRDTKATQTDLAERFGVSPVLVHYWLTEQRSPGLRTALAIEEATKGAIPASAWLVRRPARRSRKSAA